VLIQSVILRSIVRIEVMRHLSNAINRSVQIIAAPTVPVSRIQDSVMVLVIAGMVQMNMSFIVLTTMI